MPNAITAIFRADSRQMISEIEKTQIVGQGLAKTLPAAWEKGFASAFSNIQNRFTMFKQVMRQTADDFGYTSAIRRPDAHRAAIDSVKQDLAGLRGVGMMSADDSAAREEASRQVDVEMATRRNKARGLIRQREEEAKESAAAAGRAELAADSEAASRSNEARRLLRQRGEAAIASDVEQASRNNAARALLRARSAAAVASASRRCGKDSASFL